MVLFLNSFLDSTLPMLVFAHSTLKICFNLMFNRSRHRISILRQLLVGIYRISTQIFCSRIQVFKVFQKQATFSSWVLQKAVIIYASSETCNRPFQGAVILNWLARMKLLWVHISPSWALFFVCFWATQSTRILFNNCFILRSVEIICWKETSFLVENWNLLILEGTLVQTGKNFSWLGFSSALNQS